MNKYILILFALLITLPVSADYRPLSDAPIQSTQDFEDTDNTQVESPEFEYPSGENDSIAPVEVRPTKDYAKIYANLEPADFSYLHNIDPDQYYDMKDATWSPYPLLRLNSPLYFKKQAIEPGYYLLTPREHKGKWYLLFKQNGCVSSIIPVYERDITPEFFYDNHLPKPKYTFGQKVHMKTLSAFGKLKSSKRRDPIKCYMEINDLENYFVSIIVYYGNHKYSTIFRTIKL